MLQLLANAAMERGFLPDALVRRGIRRLLRQRLSECERGGESAQAEFVAALRNSPLAILPEAANEQHYELPAAFFELLLGPHRKYSSCYWPTGTENLEQAEEAALRITCEHAELADQQTILELGCGWGSLTLWMAEHYPGARITAVSNSHSQRAYITAQAEARGLRNIQVITADINDFAPPAAAGKFDRVVSVEMFEHLRNYSLLFQRIAHWLKPNGLLFAHIFCHRRWAYEFEESGSSNWMGRYFFSGGIMPSAQLLQQFDHDLEFVRLWPWNGGHYQNTAEAWLANMDASRSEILALFAQCYSPRTSRMWFQRWRIFLLAVSELFGYAGGEEWFVTHSQFRPR
jgi:cyclopropane-fatty-acyl-phospholipid synthase